MSSREPSDGGWESVDAGVALPAASLLLEEEEGYWKGTDAARERIGVVGGSIGVLGRFKEWFGQLDFSTSSFKAVG